MFTGIVEAQGVVQEVVHRDGNLRLSIQSEISPTLRPGQSVAHDGVCLTITEVDGHTHWVDIVEETLKKTHFHCVRIGQRLNLERSLTLQTPLDGHFVQGHCDQTLPCIDIVPREGSTLFYFPVDPQHAALLIPHGSIAINGVSLTVAGLDDERFYVSIIPHTMQKTNFSQLKPNQLVNVEYDLIGKYILRYAKLQGLAGRD